MKWLALFWVYRREFFVGWMRGWRSEERVMPRNVYAGPLPPLGELEKQMVRDAVDSRLRLFTAADGRPKLPGWIERPLEAPEWSEDAVKRFYGR